MQIISQNKLVEAKVVELVTSKDIVQFLIEIFSKVGIPILIIISWIMEDNSTPIIQKYFWIFMTFIFTLSHHYYPKSNGLIEKRNKKIDKLLKLIGSKYINWD